MSNTPPKHRAQPGNAGQGPVPAAVPPKPVPKSNLLPRRRWPRRTLIVVNAIVFICLAVMGSAYGYVRYRLSTIVTAPGRHLTPDGQYAGGGSQSATGDADGLKPENILLIGNETRQGLTSAEQQYLGSSVIYSGSLADIMMVLHLDPATRSASILSIPRDLFTPMPAGSPVGSYQKLDAALNDGKEGPDNLAEAVEEDFGIPINHFIELNFNGFINSVNALGGINVYFPEPVYDAESLLHITEPGCHHLNGQSALELVRARHLQYDPPGDDEPYYDWPQEAQSDLARIVRTHTFIKLVAARARQEFSNPIALNNFVGDVLDQMTVDPGLRNELPVLAVHYLHINLATVPELTLPTTDVDGSYYYDGYDMGDVEFPVQPDDDNVIKQWDSNALPAPVAPKSVQVVSIAGDASAALSAGQDLASDGLHVTGETVGTVPASTSETLVMYHPGSTAEALAVMKYLSGAVMLEESPTVAPGDVVVDLGSTVAVQSHRSAKVTTTTGQAGATTTTLGPTTTVSTTTTEVTTTTPTSSTPGKTTKATKKRAAVSTTTVPTPGGSPVNSAQNAQEPWDPRACPAGSKVIRGS